MAELAIDPNRRYRLSRHLQLWPANTGFVAMSLITGKHLALRNSASLRALLSVAQSVALSEVLGAAPADARAGLLQFFDRCLADGLITEVDDSDRAAEETLSSPNAWERHDLFFHLASRRGRNPASVGATWHLQDAVAAEPPHPPARSDSLELVTLPSIDIERLKETDRTLTWALESRRSRYSTSAVALPALSELLFRACRVTRTFQANDEGLAQKVYPSGGARHSLSIYLVVLRCRDLASGGYRYDALRHRLEKLRELDGDLTELLREAQVATGVLRELPSVLLIAASRFGRVSRKYQSNAYRLVLQEVGALFQTVYLVAESMGLAVSAVGAGDSDRFAHGFGTDFFAEPSVGEMIVGGGGPG